MPEKRRGIEDPVVDAGFTLAILSFIFMIAFANPFNPIPFMASIAGLIAGLYIIAMRVSPEEARALRKSLLKKLDFLFKWSIETSEKSIKTAKKKIEDRRKRDNKEKETTKTELKIECSECGHLNTIPVSRVYVEQETSEPKVQAFTPMYEPLDIVKCEKCGETVADPKQLIRIYKKEEL